MESNVNPLNLESGVVARVEGATPGDESIELRRVPCHLTESLFKRLLRMIFPDQRKNERQLQPPLVGYLGMTHTSRPFELGDISLSGFCLLTDERWTPGTEIPITLQRRNVPEGKDPESFTVQATVVRSGTNGVGFSIVLTEEDSQAVHGNPLRVRWITRREMEAFLNDLKDQPVQEEPVVGTSIKAEPALKAAFEGGR
jgi:hypothetical protein